VERLKALFAFIYRNLAEADLHHDPIRAGNAIRVLRTHRETWVALGEQLRRDNETMAATAPQHSWES
jgi:flagellar secretion chaperone FliS